MPNLPPEPLPGFGDLAAEQTFNESQIPDPPPPVLAPTRLAFPKRPRFEDLLAKASQRARARAAGGPGLRLGSASVLRAGRVRSPSVGQPTAFGVLSRQPGQASVLSPARLSSNRGGV